MVSEMVRRFYLMPIKTSMHTIVVMCSLFGLLLNLREVMDPREKTGWKVDVQWVSVN